MINAQSLATGQLNAITTALGTNATLVFYSGTVPAGPDTALSGNTALVTGTVSSWGSSTYNGTYGGMASTATFSAANYAPAATGTATFARLLTSGGTALAQLTVGTTGTDIIMGTTSVVTGTNVAMTLALYVPSQSV